MWGRGIWKEGKEGERGGVGIGDGNGREGWVDIFR